DVVPNVARIQTTPAARAIYTHDGRLYSIGELMVQADLARTLSRLAAGGPEEFYRGSIAQEIAADFASNGGFIKLSDLAAYRVDVTEPLRGTYRGLSVACAGPPAGGFVLLQMLSFLERFDLRAFGWPSTESARLLVEAMDRELVADRADTTHVCVVDDEGNAVSLTHTLGSASGVVTPGLGFGYNDYMNCFDPRPGRPGSIEAGKTRVTRMVPTMVFDDSRLRICVGAPGGTKIVGAVLQVLVNLIDHRMSPVEAVSAPRVDFQGDVVQAEARIPQVVCDGLSRLGYKVNRRTLNYDSYFARPQVIVAAEDGSLSGASDPRKDGGVAFATETR
ncbi:MAG TPA: gamma-glutamyltransferase, partial [Candidatus Dormibacteraeota bacterium]|nr:gamma-glutamyltransferase [Candidatus Dormibacteraeota bacterium]